jgi:hypothetical protein
MRICSATILCASLACWPGSRTATQACPSTALRAALDLFLEAFHAALAEESGKAVDGELLAAQRAQVAAASPLLLALY